MMKSIAGLLIAALSAAPSASASYDWSVNAKVTAIEVTYFPTSIDFKIDQAAGSCAQGSLITWVAQGSDATTKAQNAQAALSLLMTAKSSNQSVTLFGKNDGCTVQYLWIA